MSVGFKMYECYGERQREREEEKARHEEEVKKKKEGRRVESGYTVLIFIIGGRLSVNET